MERMMCLRRLIGRRRVLLSIIQTHPTCTYNNNSCNCNNYYYNSKTVSSPCFSRFYSFGITQTHFTDECDSEKDKGIEKGDIVNLSQLLFTSNRDYLFRYNDPRPVTPEMLAGKVIVLYFVPLDRSSFCLDSNYRKTLMDTYNDLKSNKCFEVVLVVVDDIPIFSQQPGQICFDPSLQGKFDDICSESPSWPAVPFSDITSRQRLKTKLGLSFKLYDPMEVLLDSKGMVLDTSPQQLFETYGSEAYPFSDKRISFLKSRDKTAFSQPSLKALLGSSERDFVISNKGDKVQFSQLAGKRIILLFEGDYPEYDGFDFCKNLKEKYMLMKGTADEFEVIYFPNSKDINGKRVADVPWLVSCPVELLHGCSGFLSFHGKCCNRYQSSFLLAFGQDGSLVRRTICPQFGDNYFPYSADDGGKESTEIRSSNFCWGYWDTLYKGLLRESHKQINFIGGDLLFCIYCNLWEYY